MNFISLLIALPYQSGCKSNTLFYFDKLFLKFFLNSSKPLITNKIKHSMNFHFPIKAAAKVILFFILTSFF